MHVQTRFTHVPVAEQTAHQPTQKTSVAPSAGSHGGPIGGHDPPLDDDAATDDELDDDATLEEDAALDDDAVDDAVLDDELASSPPPDAEAELVLPGSPEVPPPIADAPPSVVGEPPAPPTPSFPPVPAPVSPSSSSDEPCAHVTAAKSTNRATAHKCKERSFMAAGRILGLYDSRGERRSQAALGLRRAQRESARDGPIRSGVAGAMSRRPRRGGRSRGTVSMPSRFIRPMASTGAWTFASLSK